MRVVRLRAPGGPEQLAVDDADRPRPGGPGEALVRVHAAAITRGELEWPVRAAGNVGGYAVQLARAAGAHVIGSASATNLDLVLDLGAHEAVDAAEDAVEPVDVVFDTVGGERLRRSRAVLRSGGRLVSVAEEPPEGGVYFVVEPNRELLQSLARMVDAGEVRPAPIEVYPLASAREAFARSLEPGRRGKVVLGVVA